MKFVMKCVGAGVSRKGFYFRKYKIARKVYVLAYLKTRHDKYIIGMN